MSKEKLCKTGTVILLYLGFYGYLITVTKIGIAGWLSAVAGILGIVAYECFEQKQRYLQVGLLAAVLLFAILVICKVKFVNNGIYLIMNQIADTAGSVAGYIWKQYEVTLTKGQLPAEILALLFPSLAIAAFSSFLVQKRSSLFLMISAGVILTGSFLLGIFPSILVFAAFTVIILTYLAFFQSGRISYVGILAVLAFGVLAVGGSQSYTQPAPIAVLHEKILTAWSDFRYEKKKPSSYEQGKLANVGDLTLSKTEALRITMSEPTSFYLRGFVGETFTNQGWSTSLGDRYYKNQDLFYWLHQEKFYGQTQFASLAKIEQVEGSDSLQIAVKNINANSKYIYTPYEMTTLPSEISDGVNTMDSSIISSGFFGNRSYKFKSSTSLIPQYPSIASHYYKNKDIESYASYTQAESYYNTYVYDTYLTIPDTDAELLGQYLQTVQNKDGVNHISYEDANQLVMGCLNDQVTYSEKIDAYDGTTDFLRYFLEEEKQGYALYYASAATLMYRYLGIPARYVEGYLVTPELVADAKAYASVSVTGEQAHAWTEIYMDGIGWIPMEVTPPYLSVMQRPEFNVVGSGSSDTANQEGSQSQESIKENKVPDPNVHVQKNSSHWKIVLYLLAGFLAGVVILFLFWRGRTFQKRRKLRQKCYVEDIRDSICSSYQYISLLYNQCKLPLQGGSHYNRIPKMREAFGDAYAVQYEEAVALWEEAMFSTHELSSDQKQHMLTFLEKTGKSVKDKMSFLQYIKMRLWDYYK